MKIYLGQIINYAEINATHRAIDIVEYNKQHISRRIAERLVEFIKIEENENGKKLTLELDIFPSEIINAMMREIREEIPQTPTGEFRAAIIFIHNLFIKYGFPINLIPEEKPKIKGKEVDSFYIDDPMAPQPPMTKEQMAEWFKPGKGGNDGN